MVPHGNIGSPSTLSWWDISPWCEKHLHNTGVIQNGFLLLYFFSTRVNSLSSVSSLISMIQLHLLVCGPTDLHSLDFSLGSLESCCVWRENMGSYLARLCLNVLQLGGNFVETSGDTRWCQVINSNRNSLDSHGRLMDWEAVRQFCILQMGELSLIWPFF